MSCLRKNVAGLAVAALLVALAAATPSSRDIGECPYTMARLATAQEIGSGWFVLELATPKDKTLKSGNEKQEDGEDFCVTSNIKVDGDSLTGNFSSYLSGVQVGWWTEQYSRGQNGEWNDIVGKGTAYIGISPDKKFLALCQIKGHQWAVLLGKNRKVTEAEIENVVAEVGYQNFDFAHICPDGSESE